MEDGGGSQKAMEGGSRGFNVCGPPLMKSLEDGDFLNFLEENKENNDDVDFSSSQKTAEGNVAFNLEEEFALFAYYENLGKQKKAQIVEDPIHALDEVRFYQPQLDEDRDYLGEEAQCGPKNEIHNLTEPPQFTKDSKAHSSEEHHFHDSENTLPQIQTRQEEKRKDTHRQKLSATQRSTRKARCCRTKANKSSVNRLQEDGAVLGENQHDEDSSDDVREDEEEEARVTWEIGKKLNLKTPNEDKAKEALVILRRSPRRRGNNGDGGNQGIGGSGKSGAIKKLIKTNNPAILRLVETKHSLSMPRRWRSWWSIDDLGWKEVQAINGSGGLILMWNQSLLKVSSSSNGEMWINIEGKWTNSDSLVSITLNKHLCKNGIWGTISSIPKWSNDFELLIAKGCWMKVASGNKTRFWLDKWLDNETLKTKFPTLFSVSIQKEEVIANMGFWDGLQWNWNLSWRRHLYQWEQTKLEEL
ncbi:hypothetical protein RIF29_10309 [Crotalaria pallida]|uniref:Uncharacterized protein n=1 Tax=Crotalaria pallida TaxID=3830 RepID=A0AAN9FSS3_CROPI